MEILLNYLIEKYGYDEPIFTKDLQKELNIKSGSLRQAIKRLTDKGLITKARNGIYFIPNKNTILKKTVLSVDKIVKNKYINSKQKGVIGYKTGTNFANSIGLTTQTAVSQLSLPIIPPLQKEKSNFTIKKSL